MLRSILTVSGFTMMSRVLGLVRDILIGRLLGAGAVSDAFFAGFRFPNMFRRIFGEGAFNAAFVPMFGRELADNGEDEARVFANQAFSLLAWTLVIGTIVAIPLMRWIMAIFTPGFLLESTESFSWPWLLEMVRYPHGSEKFETTVAFARIMFSYLMCMALAAHLSGVLNTLKVFAAPAFAPVLLNIITITGLGVVVPVLGFDADVEKCGLVLSWSVFASGLAQLALLWIVCRRKGMAVSLWRPHWTPRMKKLLLLMAPGVLAASVQQVNLVVGTMIASSQNGAMSWLYYGDRIFQLPLGIIGIAFGIVLLPEITRLVRAEDEVGITHSLGRGYTFSMLITLPAMVAMLVIPEPIMRTLFENGVRFTTADTTAAAAALRAFALGLPAYILVKVLQPAYFAREDTKRPMLMAIATVATNVALSIALFPSIGFVGIAVATSVAGWVNYYLLYRGVKKTVPMTRVFVSQLARIFAAAIVMGAGLWLGRWLLSGWLNGAAWEQIVALTVLIGSGMAVYAAAAVGLKAMSIRELKAGFGR